MPEKLEFTRDGMRILLTIDGTDLIIHEIAPIGNVKACHADADKIANTIMEELKKEGLQIEKIIHIPCG